MWKHRSCVHFSLRFGWKVWQMKIRTRAVSWKSTFRSHSESIWFVAIAVCVSSLSRRSPCIRLQQPIRTYDYYQFVILLSLSLLLLLLLLLFIDLFILIAFAMCADFSLCPLHTQTNRNSGRYASPFDHLNVIHYSPLCVLIAHLTSHSSNAARTLRNGKLWENVRRRLAAASWFRIAIFVFSFCLRPFLLLFVSKDLNPHPFERPFRNKSVHLVCANDSICSKFNSKQYN